MSLPPLATGSTVDAFRLEEKIYEGGMASLWRVTSPDASLPLVMKVPRLDYGDDPAAIVGFEVEQMVLPSLTGVHFPRFVAAGDFTARPYIVMEYIPGPSLRAQLEAAPLPPPEVAALGARIATALHDAHRQDVIHLDLKPSSVLFRASGEAVLIDFGLAHHNRLPDLLAEEFRLPMGTGPYMAPEQVVGVRSEPRSDLFALGVVLYHFATGERPFGNPSTIGGLRRRLYRGPVPPRRHRPDCPPWLQEVILRCLEIEPAARYDTAAQVAFDLQHPEQIALTARAERREQDGLGAMLRRRLRVLDADGAQKRSPADQLARAPIVMAAVDVTPGTDALAESLASAVRRIVGDKPAARLACVTVLRTPRIGIESNLDEQGQNRHVQRLVELKHWARPLGLPAHRVTFHVLEAPDPASAIIEFAGANNVDEIVLGARGSSTLRRFLGSVSSEVVAGAHCTVTVVRPDRGAHLDGDT